MAKLAAEINELLHDDRATLGDLVDIAFRYDVHLVPLLVPAKTARRPRKKRPPGMIICKSRPSHVRRPDRANDPRRRPRRKR